MHAIAMGRKTGFPSYVLSKFSIVFCIAMFFLVKLRNHSVNFFLINNSEIFIRTELQIVHKACTMKQE